MTMLRTSASEHSLPQDVSTPEKTYLQQFGKWPYRDYECPNCHEEKAGYWFRPDDDSDRQGLNNWCLTCRDRWRKARRYDNGGVVAGQKRCPKCQKVKYIEEFYGDVMHPSSRCMPCTGGSWSRPNPDPDKLRKTKREARDRRNRRSHDQRCDHELCRRKGIGLALRWLVGDNPICYLCHLPLFWGEALNEGREFHFEHLMPLSLGGMECVLNILPACGYCNTVKGKKPLSAISSDTSTMDLYGYVRFVRRRELPTNFLVMYERGEFSW